MKKSSKKKILIFLLLVFTLSCEKDDGIITKKQQESVNFKTVLKSEIDDFMKQTKEDTVKSETNFITAISDEINYEDITNSDKKVAVIEVKTKYKNLKSKVVLLKVYNEVQSVVVSLKPFDYSTETSFSGKIVITDVNGVFIKAYKVEENIFISKYILKNSSKTKDGFENKCDETLDPTSSYCFNFLEEVMLTDVSNSPPTPYVSIAHMYPSGGGGEQSGCEVGCNNSWDPIGGGGGSGSYPIDNEEDRIVNELDDPCANNIFTQLEIGSLEQRLKQTMNPETNSFFTFSESILEMFRGSDVIDLTIQNGNTGDSNAHTNGAAITIGDDYLDNATELSIARTMIHESVHAYINAMYSHTIEFNSFSFQEKLNKYAEDNGYTIGTNEFHHEFMGQYVNAMAISLLKWDIDYGTGGNLGWDYYQSLAYAGLSKIKRDSNGNPILDSNSNPIRIDTDSFKELVPNENDRNNIKRTIKNEAESNSNSKGTECN